MPSFLWMTVAAGRRTRCAYDSSDGRVRDGKLAHEYDVRLFRSPGESAGSVSMRSITTQPVGRIQGSSLRLRRPPVEPMHGPAGIPETRFHFRRKCLRLGRVGNTCTFSYAFWRTLCPQHKRRVFITFRGKQGQSHLSCGARFSFWMSKAWLFTASLREDWVRARQPPCLSAGPSTGLG